MTPIDYWLTDPASLRLAYLDPGSGAILIQMLLAGAAGLGLFFKYQGRRFLALLGFKRNAPVDSDQAGDETDEN